VVQFHNNGEPTLYPYLEGALSLFWHCIRQFNTNGKLLVEKAYEIIGNLQTSHAVDVYGDEGWQNVCPQYYRGCLDNEGIERLYAGGHNLYLLMNFSFSYLDASGPVYDVVRRGVRFINVSPIVKTISLEDMERLEYADYETLNRLVNNPPVHPALDQALINLREYYRDGMEAAALRVGITEQGTGMPIQFENQLRFHKQLMQSKVAAFLDQHEGFVRDTLKRMFDA
jgi:hypothetical protein